MDGTRGARAADETASGGASSAPAARACSCLVPIPREVAERKGVARTHCGRCGLPLPLRLRLHLGP